MNDFMKNAMENITTSKCLAKKDEKIITDLQEELSDCIDKKQEFRTETEMEASVLSKFISFPDKYWQCVREQSSMFASLAGQSGEVIRVEGELELLRLELKNLEGSRKVLTPKDQIVAKMLNAQIRQNLMNIASLKHKLHYRAVEVKHWEKLKQKLLKAEKFDSSDVETHQKESYRQKWKNEIALGKNQYNNQINLNALEKL